MIKILLVDDVPDILDTIATLLESVGYQIDKCLSVRDALKNLEQERYNLIITDVLMPDMSGYDLISSVRAQEKYAPVPFIAMSGGATDHHNEEVLKKTSSCVDIFLKKPVSPEELLRSVNILLESMFQENVGEVHNATNG